MTEEKLTISHIIHISKPIYLLSGVLFFALGVGIADYLGYSLDWKIYFLGQASITLLQLSSYFLDAYFTRIMSRRSFSSESFTSRKKNDEVTLRLLTLAVSLLTCGAVLTVVLFFQGSMNIIVLFFLGFSFFLEFFSAVPPLRFQSNGYGEMVDAIFHTCLIPSFAFVLQSQELHHILPLLTFPLFFLFLAMRLAHAFPSYASDIKARRNTMLTRLSWQTGMNIHNLLILIAYLLLLASTLLGLSWGLIYPALLVTPVGLYQIWQMIRIASGAKPNWKILVYTATANLGLCAYLITLTLWIV